MNKGKLKPEDEESVRKHYVELKQNIDAIKLIDILYQEKVITSDDREKIKKETTKSERNETLLQAILDSGPGDNLKIFLSALEMHYSHLKIVQERSNQSAEGQKSSSTLHHLQSNTKMKSRDITVLLVGETIHGKSSARASLVRLDNEHTPICQALKNKEIHTVQYYDRKISFIDSPSIQNYRNDSQTLIDEIQNSFDRVLEGFHAVLLTIRYEKVIKNEDLEVVNTLKSLYGPEILKNYCVLVLTHGDQLKAENISFQDWCLEQEEFQKLYKECGRRAVVIDNMTEAIEIQNDVLKNLIEKIDDLQFNGRRYTVDHFNKAESGRKRMLVEEKKARILEDTAAKCTAIIQASLNITTSKSDCNLKKLKSLYKKSLELMKTVKVLDEGTSILKIPLTLIKSVKRIVSEKMDILKEKKSKRKRLVHVLEKEEKTLLETIDWMREKLRDEQEKSALKRENMYLKELLKDSRLVKKEHIEVLQQEKDMNDILATKYVEKLGFNAVQNENSETVHKKSDLALTQEEHTQKLLNESKEPKNQNKLECQGQFRRMFYVLVVLNLIQFLLQSCASYNLYNYKNRIESCNRMEYDEAALKVLELMDKEITNLKTKTLKNCKNDTQGLIELQAITCFELGLLKHNQTILLQENANLKKNLTKAEGERPFLQLLMWNMF